MGYLELQHILLGNTTDPSLSYSCNHLLISTQIINSKDRKETTKMRLSTILVSASTALLSILIRAENYIQSVQDVAVAFGITPVEDYYPGTLGTFMGETSIGPGNSNIIGNITANISVPTSRPEGKATITGALFALYGRSLSGSLEYFAVNVTVGNESSSEYVASEYVVLDPVQARKWRA